MATEFANKAALVSNLETIYGAGNVGVAEEVDSRPYKVRSGGNWVENPDCPTRLYEVWPTGATGIYPTATSRGVRFLERKTDGVCWYENRVPVAVSFEAQVLDYFKQFVPAQARAPQIVSKREYEEADIQKSSALVSAIDDNGNAMFAVVYYDSGSLTRSIVSYAEAQKFIEITRGL